MLHKLLLDLKSIWKTLFFMAVIAFGVLPLICRYQSMGADLSMALGSTLKQTQLVLPAVSAIPVAMLLRFQLEEGCSEPLHAIPMVSQRTPWTLLLTELLLLIVYTLPLFWLYMRQFGIFLWQEWLRTMVQGFFLQNLAFAAGYLTHFSLSGLGVQILAIGTMQLPLYDVDAAGSLFYTVNIYSAISEFQPRLWEPMRVLIVMACGIAFWCIGARQTKYFLERRNR